MDTPRHEDDEEAGRVPNCAESYAMATDSRSPTRPRVTIVDCDDGMRAELASLFAGRGIPVQAFAKSADFLHAHDLANPALPNHLLLCRLELEENCGIRLLETVGRAGWSIRTIVYSTHGDIASAVKSFHAGAVDFIENAKPDVCFWHRTLTHLAPAPSPSDSADCATDRPRPAVAKTPAADRALSTSPDRRD